MDVVLPDTPSVYLYLTGDYEPGVTATMGKMLLPGDVLWNVGAHIGTRVVQSSNVIGPEGFVYAFEPTPRTEKVLRTNSAHIETPVKIRNIALGDTAGTVNLFDYGWAYAGSNSVCTTHPIKSGRITRAPKPTILEVPMQTVDNLVSDGYKPPSAMVVDAEGFEGQIFNGAIKTITHNLPPVIFEDGNQGSEYPEGGIGTLARLGYIFLRIEHNTHLTPLDTSPGSNDGLRNVLAIHPDNTRGLKLS